MWCFEAKRPQTTCLSAPTVKGYLITARTVERKTEGPASPIGELKDVSHMLASFNSPPGAPRYMVAMGFGLEDTVLTHNDSLPTLRSSAFREETGYRMAQGHSPEGSASRGSVLPRVRTVTQTLESLHG
ncbi:hypothetical protein NDU88_008252 [Pleurodeles waltl]|uniref:Uncharacterized protein n=1 Tax=Pleurodeles waltl TaxID=8319 RepID=A0AAV7QQ75_PLEWA|nr:hypothetical protein NDU88_008252 [Pleurodeles waltl]